ncbi:MAG: hypothetical protein AAGI30_12660, partial [Planctomycetota bacterium]
MHLSPRLAHIMLTATCTGAALAQEPISWSPLGEPGSGGRVNDVAISPHDPDHLVLCGDMLGVGLSFDGGESWEASTGFLSYEIDSATFHPLRANEVWAATMSGPHRSLDFGRTWTPMRTGMGPISDGSYSTPIESIQFDPNDPTRMLAFGGSSRRWASPGNPAWGAVWESTDAGDSWTRLATLGHGGEVESSNGLLITGAAFGTGSSDVIAVGLDDGGVAFSEDGGHAWHVRTDGLPSLAAERVRAVAGDNPQRFIVSLGSASSGGRWSGGGVFETRDAGRTWISLSDELSAHAGHTEMHAATFAGLDVAATDPKRILASDASWVSAGDRVLVSRDGGAEWDVVLGGDVPGLDLSYPAGMGMPVARIAPTDADLMYVADTEHVLRSTDGGHTWTDVMNDRVGQGFRNRGFSGLVANQITFDPYEPGVMIAQAFDAANVWLTTDNAQSFVAKARQPNPWAAGRDAWFSPKGTIYAVFGQGTFNGFARSMDNGETFEVIAGPSHGLPEQAGSIEARRVLADPDDARRVLAVIDNRLFESRDGGSNWSVAFDRHDVFWLDAPDGAIAPLYLLTSNGVYTSNGDLAFRAIGGPRTARRTAMGADGTVYVIKFEGEHAGVWRFRENVWTRLLDDPQVQDIATHPTDPERIVLATGDKPYHDVVWSRGVLLSEDGGTSWGLANDGLPMRRTTCIAFDPHDPERLVVGTAGRGFFIGQWPASAGIDSTIRYRHTLSDAEYADAAQAIAREAESGPLQNGSMAIGVAIPDSWTDTWI